MKDERFFTTLISDGSDGEMIDLEPRILDGVAWLMDAHGEFTETDIAATILDAVAENLFLMNDPCHCAVGLVLGDYCDWVLSFVGENMNDTDNPMLSYEEAIDHGFVVDKKNTVTYTCLEQAWVAWAEREMAS